MPNDNALEIIVPIFGGAVVATSAAFTAHCMHVTGFRIYEPLFSDFEYHSLGASRWSTIRYDTFGKAQEKILSGLRVKGFPGKDGWGFSCTRDTVEGMEYCSKFRGGEEVQMMD